MALLLLLVVVVVVVVVAAVVVVVVVVVQRTALWDILRNGSSFVLLFAVNSIHHFWTVFHVVNILKLVFLSATYFNTGPSFFWYVVFGFWKV